MAVTMTGRFPIEQITPAVACGAYPAKAVVGELVPVGAVAYREGHDALGLQRGLARPGRRAAPVHPDGPGGPATTAGTPPSGPTRSAPGRFTVEAFADPYLTWRNAVTKKIEAGQGAKELANDLAVGAPRAGPARPSWCRPSRAGRGAGGRDRAARRRRWRWPSGPARRSTWPTCCGSTRCGSWSPPDRAAPDLGRPASGRSSPPGTSSSPAPRARWSTATGRPVRHGTFATAAAAAARRRRDGLRRGLPAADPPDRPGQPQGPQQRARRPAATTSARRGRSASAEGGHDAIHPRAGHAGRLPARSSAAAARARPRGGAGPGPAVRAGPPVGHRASGVVHHPARRHHRLRREPAEEVPGHLPAQLRQRPGRASGPRSCGWCCTGSAQGVRIFRVDNPHTKPIDFWHWLIWQVKAGRPGRAVPGRGVHPAGHHARSGHDRLHPVLHLLHLAHDRPRSCASTARSWSRRPTTCGPTSGPTRPDILPETLQHGGPADVQDPGGAGQHALARPGASTPGTSCTSTWPAPAPRSTWTTRSTSCARGPGRRPSGPASRWRRSWPGSTRSAGPTRPCTGCATCASTTSTTTPCCAGPNATPTRTTPCWWSARSTRATRTGATPHWTCRRSASTGTSGSPVRDELTGGGVRTGVSTTRCGWTRTASRPTSSPCTATNRSARSRERHRVTIERHHRTGPRPARRARRAPGRAARPSSARCAAAPATSRRSSTASATR